MSLTNPMQLIPLAGDPRMPGLCDGTIATNNVVRSKADVDAPKTSTANALVRLHRVRDGKCVWSGKSDAQGYYHAENLERDVELIPVASDPLRRFESVAAGPMRATAAAPSVDTQIDLPIGISVSRAWHLRNAHGGAFVRLQSGALPSGVSAGTHGLTGTATGPAGDYPIVIEITDNRGTVKQDVLLSVAG